MNQYTGFDYLMIDVANQAGFDKELFEDRIHWVKSNMDNLEGYLDKADNKPLYKKAVLAIRKAQAKQPTGHLVALDACCSGIQIMSALTGCKAGAEATGMVNPNERADAYTKLQHVMQEVLAEDNAEEGFEEVSRKEAKDALMTSFYGSKKQPKKIFGEDTPELMAFYKSAMAIAPGAWELLQDLLASWRPYALFHAWKLPDGFDVKVKVMKQNSTRIEVDELGGASFTYIYYENEGSKKGLSNVANVVHSVDAYILRSMHRRCNYDVEVVKNAQLVLEGILADASSPWYVPIKPVAGSKLAYYIEQWERSGMADAVILPYLNANSIWYIPAELIRKLHDIVNTMLVHKPFPLITIHDSFASHANNCNHVRQHYINIMAELADSNVLQDIMSQLYGVQGTVTKLSDNLSELIRGSNYALS